MGDIMKAHILFGFLFLATLSANCAKEKTVQQESPIYQKAELILEVDASFDFDYQEGQRFGCPVKRVIKGTCGERFIDVYISIVPEKKEAYAGYLKPYKAYESLVMGFIELPEVPAQLSGFEDSEGRYWELIFVAKMAILEED